MLGKSFKWYILVAVLSYLWYTLSVVCPICDETKEVLPSSGLGYYTCVTSNIYIKPFYLKSVKPVVSTKINPIIENNIMPKVDELNKRFQIGEIFSSLLQKINQADKNYEISKKAVSLFDKVSNNACIALRVLKVSVSRWATSGLKFLESKWGVKSDDYLHYLNTKIELNSFKTWVLSLNFKNIIFSLYYNAKEIFSLLLEKSSNINLQKKINFIKEDFINLLKFNEFKKTVSGKSEEIVQVVKDILEEVSDSSDLSDDEVLTVKVTSTITITSESVPTDLSVVDLNELKLNNELLLWEQKVNKTLQLAVKNLKSEMEPIIQSTIEEIKPVISEKFSTLQSDNYKYYQKLNTLIKEINKDFEKINKTKEITESVSRQDVRDDIAASYELSKVIADEVNELVSTKHEVMLETYFRVIQDTIDILESFAETTMLDFSNKLSVLIAELEENSSDFDEELSWKSWKMFHGIKEEIFTFRDLIFDQANNYKNKISNTTPNGLETWTKYLRNVEFHSNFLLRDNDDYLKLVRAKANVAFQLREGIVRKLETQKLEVSNSTDTSESDQASIIESVVTPATSFESIAQETIKDGTGQATNESVNESLDEGVDEIMDEIVDDENDSAGEDLSEGEDLASTLEDD